MVRSVARLAGRADTAGGRDLLVEFSDLTRKFSLILTGVTSFLGKAHPNTKGNAFVIQNREGCVFSLSRHNSSKAGELHTGTGNVSINSR